MNIALQEEVTQVFSCEFCEIFKNTCFTQQLLTTASRMILIISKEVSPTRLPSEL